MTTKAYRTDRVVRLHDGRLLHELGWELDESRPSRRRLVYTYETDVDLTAIDPRHVAASVPASLRAEAADLWGDAVEHLAAASGANAAGIRATHGLITYEFRYRRAGAAWTALPGRYGARVTLPG